MTVCRINNHGGNIYQASRQYGAKLGDFLDYSANINPFGLPKSARAILSENIDSLVNYPDPDCTELKEEISEYLRVDKENIIVGNGASEIIYLLFEILRPGRVLMPAPSFSEYGRAAKMSGAEIEYFKLREEECFELDMDRLLTELDPGINMIFLCNPNNPTSTLVGKNALLKLIEAAKEKNITVVIDEAFIELTAKGNESSMVQYVREYDNLFIIRAFTKLFAIPGLRLGYGMGNIQTVRKMWEQKQPWSVNSLACCMGRMLSLEKEYMNKTCKWIQDEKEWFYEQLNCMPQLKAFRPQSNFILVKLLKEGVNAELLRERMASNGILIRNAENFMYLDDRFVRFAIKDRVNNVKFLKTLQYVIDSIDGSK